MGILWSSTPHLKQTYSLSHTSTRIVAIQSISMRAGESTTEMWIYQSRINDLPIKAGQNISIFRHCASMNQMGPQSGAIVEGRIGDIVRCSHDWVTFQIISSSGPPTLLCVPATVTNPTLYERLACSLANLIHTKHLHNTDPEIPPSTPTIQTYRLKPSYIAGDTLKEDGAERTRWSESDAGHTVGVNAV